MEQSRKEVLKQTGLIAIGQAVGTAVMIGVFCLLRKFNMTVIWGALVGNILATANFFFMAIIATIAADRAEKQDVAGGQKLIQLSYMGRMAGLLLVLVLCAKSGIFHVLALAIPLVFTRPVLTVAEIFKKKGGNQV